MIAGRLDEDVRLIADRLGFFVASPYVLFPVNAGDRFNRETCDYFNGLHRAAKARAEEARRDGDWHRYVYCHRRPYEVDAFAEIAENLSDADYWDTLGLLWCTAGLPWQSKRTWRRLWLSSRPGREQHGMDEGERRTLAGLPDRVTVYRGCGHKRGWDGYSWTLSRDKAIWFARRRLTKRAYLGTCEISRADILAYFSSEAEVVTVARVAAAWQSVGMG